MDPRVAQIAYASDVHQRGLRTRHSAQGCAFLGLGDVLLDFGRHIQN